MNKGLIWFLVIIAIILLSIFIYVSMQSSQSEEMRSEELDVLTETDEGYTDIQTADDDFSEIDRALEFID